MTTATAITSVWMLDFFSFRISLCCIRGMIFSVITYILIDIKPFLQKVTLSHNYMGFYKKRQILDIVHVFLCD